MTIAKKKIYLIVWDIASYDGKLLLSLWTNKEAANAEIDRLISRGEHDKNSLSLVLAETDCSSGTGESILCDN